MKSSTAKTLTNDTAHSQQSEESEIQGPWPRDVSRKPEYAIGKVQLILAREFPTITVSKIRFLGDQGLIHPTRSVAGYRLYSQADIERIRYVLTEQRDSYAPLKAIAAQLCALDAGHEIDRAPSARVVAADGVVVSPINNRAISARELADLTGTTVETLERYAASHLISPDLGGYFPARTIQVVSILLAIETTGIDARVLLAVRAGADRSADIISQSVATLRSRGRSGDVERANSRSMDLAELFADLHREMLRVSLSSLNEIGM